MGIGYLLGGIACLLYAALVGYFGGIKKSPGLLKLVKMKLNKKYSCSYLEQYKAQLNIFR